MKNLGYGCKKKKKKRTKNLGFGGWSPTSKQTGICQGHAKTKPNSNINNKNKNNKNNNNNNNNNNKIEQIFWNVYA